MKIIGLCGGSGSGKSVVGAEFQKRGFIVIDTDKVYRNLTENKSHCLDALVCEFGGEILTPFGTLDRAKLRDVVFSDKEKLSLLNEITHKFILAEVRDIISKSVSLGVRGAVVDAPLLYESGFDKECHVVVAVTASRDLRISRIMKRDNISKEQAILRINSQMSDEELSQKADYVITNNGEILDVGEQVAKIVSQVI